MLAASSSLSQYWRSHLCLNIGGVIFVAISASSQSQRRRLNISGVVSIPASSSQRRRRLLRLIVSNFVSTSALLSLSQRLRRQLYARRPTDSAGRLPRRNPEAETGSGKGRLLRSWSQKQKLEDASETEAENERLLRSRSWKQKLEDASEVEAETG